MNHKIETFPNPDCICIHVQKRLTQKMCERFESPSSLIHVYSDDGAVAGTKEQPAYVKRLFSVNGIQTVHIDQFSINLTKGSAFDWETMLPQIMAILELELEPV